jgi:hypothetical protein
MLTQLTTDNKEVFCYYGIFDSNDYKNRYIRSFISDFDRYGLYPSYNDFVKFEDIFISFLKSQTNNKYLEYDE